MDQGNISTFIEEYFSLEINNKFACNSCKTELEPSLDQPLRPFFAPMPEGRRSVFTHVREGMAPTQEEGKSCDACNSKDFTVIRSFVRLPRFFTI